MVHVHCMKESLNTLSRAEAGNKNTEENNTTVVQHLSYLQNGNSYKSNSMYNTVLFQLVMLVRTW